MALWGAMSFLDAVLLTAATWVAVSTVLLVLAGRRRAGLAWRVVAAGGAASASVAVSVVAGAGLGVALGAVVGIAVVALVLPRAWWPAGAVFFAGLAVAAGVYAAYLLRATVLMSDDPIGLLLGTALLGLALGAIALMVAGAFEMVDALCADAEPPATPPDPVRWPVVALQVPTYNEPPELVIETLRSLVGLDYPALVVQVIDNNTTDEALWRPVEEEASRLARAGHRVTFAHLPTWPGYKAGALNWGREQLPDDVEIIGVIDADYVVDRAYLRATVPHFGEPDVAFVQTPQDYRAWEESGFYRACYVGFAYFFRVGMVSRARRNSIIFAGTMGLIRRSVLDEIGGWDEATITEDAEASLRILARGYRAAYIPTSFGHGIMPLTYEGLRKQRFRWAFGGIQILRKHWRLLVPWSRTSRLTIPQRLDHLVGGLWWFNDALTFCFTLFVAAAGLALLLGSPFIVQRLSPIGVVLPLVFIALGMLRYLWAARVSTGASAGLAFGALRVNFSLSWVVALACVRGLIEDRGVFLRTPKFRGSARARVLTLVGIETALAVACLALAVVTLGRSGVVLGDRVAAGWVVAGLLGWSALIYASATAFALADPERAPLSEILRAKARLELAPRVGRAVRTRRARGGFAVAASTTLLLLFGVGLLAEADRRPVAELGSIEDTLLAPSEGRGSDEVEPPAPTPPQPTAPPPTEAVETPAPAGTPEGAPFVAAPTPTPAPAAEAGQTPPVPVPTPAPTPAPAAEQTPPVPVPTPPPAAEQTPPVPVPTPPPAAP